MDTNSTRKSLDMLHRFFRGGEENGRFLNTPDVLYTLADALNNILYTKFNPKRNPYRACSNYFDNASFWNDALQDKLFPGACIVLDNFHLLEWIPFSPGRYFTKGAKDERLQAAHSFLKDSREYIPKGKGSMVQGGIGTIRLAEKTINGKLRYFLGASSTGVAHQGIPIVLESEEYHKVVHIIKEYGGCQVKLVGSLQTMTDNFPVLRFHQHIPRFCLFAEEVSVKQPSTYSDLVTTVAIMFTVDKSIDAYKRRCIGKSWTFCSFHPGSPRRYERSEAIEWLLDYAMRYSHDEPIILTDFDEYYNFPCRVEFPISDILNGKVDWETLNIYKQRCQNTVQYIGTMETYIKEYQDNSMIQINQDNSRGYLTKVDDGTANIGEITVN